MRLTGCIITTTLLVVGDVFGAVGAVIGIEQDDYPEFLVYETTTYLVTIPERTYVQPTATFTDPARVMKVIENPASYGVTPAPTAAQRDFQPDWGLNPANSRVIDALASLSILAAEISAWGPNSAFDQFRSTAGHPGVSRWTSCDDRTCTTTETLNFDTGTPLAMAPRTPELSRTTSGHPSFETPALPRPTSSDWIRNKVLGTTSIAHDGPDGHITTQTTLEYASTNVSLTGHDIHKSSNDPLNPCRMASGCGTAYTTKTIVEDAVTATWTRDTGTVTMTYPGTTGTMVWFDGGNMFNAVATPIAKTVEGEESPSELVAVVTEIATVYATVVATATAAQQGFDSGGKSLSLDPSETKVTRIPGHSHVTISNPVKPTQIETLGINHTTGPGCSAPLQNATHPAAISGLTTSTISSVRTVSNLHHESSTKRTTMPPSTTETSGVGSTVPTLTAALSGSSSVVDFEGSTHVIGMTIGMAFCAAAAAYFL